MRVYPDERQALVAGSEALDRADMRAATAAEDERSLGQLGGERERLVAERLLLDDRRLRIRER